MLDIVNAPNPILSQKTKPITKINREILNLIEEMKQSLEFAIDPVGVGLAAPQVGKNLRIFIIKPSIKSRVSVFINPKIIKKSLPQEKKGKEKTRKLEGCLSLPNIWGEVLRYDEVYLEYQDEAGKNITKNLINF